MGWICQLPETCQNCDPHWSINVSLGHLHYTPSQKLQRFRLYPGSGRAGRRPWQTQVSLVALTCAPVLGQEMCLFLTLLSAVVEWYFSSQSIIPPRHTLPFTPPSVAILGVQVQVFEVFRAQQLPPM